jgi:hypothetical protein
MTKKPLRGHPQSRAVYMPPLPDFYLPAPTYCMERLAFAEYVTRRDEGFWLPDANPAPGLAPAVPDPRTHGKGNSTCKNPNPPGSVSSTCRPAPKPSWSKPIHRLKGF